MSNTNDKLLGRRRFLRGAVRGATITVGLPLLNCMLNENGSAFAATGRPIPQRFGTWFWGLGYTPGRWVPEDQGTLGNLPPELLAIDSVRDQVNVFSGFDVMLDGKPNDAHVTGNIAFRTGSTPSVPDTGDEPTIDVLVANHIGSDTRFRSLELTATGNPKDSYSRRSYNAINPSEASPIALYNRLFGSGFSDPNAAEFSVDPKVLSSMSVLSTIADERKKLMRGLGQEDRIRMEEYFTSIRQLENQLSLQTQKPEKNDDCKIPKSITRESLGYDIEMVEENHRIMAELLAMALVCDQTRVFNMTFSDSGSHLRRRGSSSIHHQYTHEEYIDSVLGYQENSAWFAEQSMKAWALFVDTLRNQPEAGGTLLDNMLVVAHSDCSYAKTHSVQNLPVMTAGTLGGKCNSGMHVRGNGAPVTQLGLTFQQLMGIDIGEWGTQSMKTQTTVRQILA